MLEIKELSKSFGKLKVLNAISINSIKGGIFAILGPNGSGKTTLIKSILGMVIPDGGSIKINNKDVIGQWAYRDQITYMPQIANFPPNLKVSELIELIKDIRAEKTNEVELIKLFGLSPFLDKKFATLSGGTKQKVNIVLAFMFETPIIILDEPTTGLDPVALIHLKDLIKEKKKQGKTILITSHIMGFVEELSDTIVFLLEGEIYFNGSLRELKLQANEKDLEHAIAKILRQTYA